MYTPAPTLAAPHPTANTPGTSPALPVEHSEDLESTTRTPGQPSVGGSDPTAHGRSDFHLKKKCKNCNIFYVEAENGERTCVFHPGRHYDPYASPIMNGIGGMALWSCCRAIEGDAPGCVAGRHVEDPQTNKALKQFDEWNRQFSCKQGAPTYHPSEQDKTKSLSQPIEGPPSYQDALAQKSWSASLEPPTYEEVLAQKGKTVALASPFVHTEPVDKTENPIHKGSEEGGHFITHHVRRTDTLAGLALAYNTSRARIRRDNQLLSDDIRTHFTLRIFCADAYAQEERPPAPEKSAAQVESMLMRCGCSCCEEARYYCALHSGDAAEAVAAKQADDEWAARHSFSAWKRARVFEAKPVAHRRAPRGLCSLLHVLA